MSYPFNLPEFWIALALLATILVFLALAPRRRGLKGKFTWANQSEDNSMSKVLHLGAAAVAASVAYTNKDGGAATVVGAPKWTVSPDGVVSVTPAADGLSAQVAPVAVGTATISVVAEGDETAGVDTIMLSADVTVAEEEATGGTLSFQ